MAKQPMYKYNQQRRKSLSQNWGSSFLRTKISREQYLLEKRTFRDLKYWEWFYIIISVLGVLINLGFNGYQLTMAAIHGIRYLFPILLCVNNLFAMYFLFVGIMKELPFQILMQLITKVIIWIFNLLYFLTPKENVKDEDEDEVKDIQFYVSSSMLFLTTPVAGFVFYKYWTSNLSLFKSVGTEPKYVKMCRTKFCGQSLIALDVEITFVALLLVASSAIKSTELDLFAIIVLPVGFFFVLFWAFIGWYAMNKESRILTYTFYILSHLQPLYIIFLLVRSTKDSVGALLFYSMIVVAGLFFFIHVALLATIVNVQMNYDKGLKQAAEKEIARTKSLAQSLNNVNTDFIDRPGGPRHTEI